jgi:hypothetical protein
MSIIRTVLRPAATVAVALGLTLAGAGIAAAARAAPAAVNAVQTITLQPARVTQFQWVAGQAQWAQPSLSRLSRSVFQAQAGGRFVMAQPDGYPTVVGRFSADGSYVADYRSSVGSVGSTSVHISGRISQAADGTVQMSIVYESGSVTAAVVNNTPFGASGSKVYRAQMVVSVR